MIFVNNDLDFQKAANDSLFQTNTKNKEDPYSFQLLMLLLYRRKKFSLKGIEMKNTIAHSTVDEIEVISRSGRCRHGIGCRSRLSSRSLAT